MVPEIQQVFAALAIAGANIFHLIQNILLVENTFHLFQNTLLVENTCNLFQYILPHCPHLDHGQIQYQPGMDCAVCTKCSGQDQLSFNLFRSDNRHEDGSPKGVDDLQYTSQNLISQCWPRIFLHPNLAGQVHNQGFCIFTKIFCNLSDTVPGKKTQDGFFYQQCS